MGLREGLHPRAITMAEIFQNGIHNRDFRKVASGQQAPVAPIVKDLIPRITLTKATADTSDLAW